MNCCLRRLVFLVVVLFAGGAQAQSANSRADELLTRGQKLFAEGKYAEAIEQLRAGYVIAPQPRFQYALGQAYRLNHQCKEAVRAYRDFLRADPSKGQAEAAESNIKRCGDEDPSSLVEPETVKPVVPEPTVAVVPAATTTPVDSPTPTYKKWWPWTILGVVLVGAGVGVGLGLGLRASGSKFDATLPEVGPNANAASALSIRF